MPHSAALDRSERVYVAVLLGERRDKQISTSTERGASFAVFYERRIFIAVVAASEAASEAASGLTSVGWR